MYYYNKNRDLVTKLKTASTQSITVLINTCRTNGRNSFINMQIGVGCACLVVGAYRDLVKFSYIINNIITFFKIFEGCICTPSYIWIISVIIRGRIICDTWMNCKITKH